MFGNGLYEHESYFKAPINKGTDAVILFLIVPLFAVLTFYYPNGRLRIKLLHAGILSVLLYYSTLQAFELAFNPLYLVYLFMFSSALFAFILSLRQIRLEKIAKAVRPGIPHRLISIFLVLAGLSVFVWLLEIIAALQEGRLPEHVGAGVTLPTYAIDIGLIAPSAFLAAWLVARRKPQGYVLAVILLTLNAAIGLIVLSQTLFQYSYGVILSMEEFIPFVSVFVILSLVAMVLDVMILKNIREG
jgi:hypothetical protein